MRRDSRGSPARLVAERTARALFFIFTLSCHPSVSDALRSPRLPVPPPAACAFAHTMCSAASCGVGVCRRSALASAYASTSYSRSIVGLQRRRRRCDALADVGAGAADLLDKHDGTVSGDNEGGLTEGIVLIEDQSPASLSSCDSAESQQVKQSPPNQNERRAYPPTPSLRECFSFAVPALGIYAAPPLLSLIDAAFIGRVSSVQLAALGPASSISDSASLPLLFLSIAATNLVAKSSAEGDDAAASRVARSCLGLGAIGGAFLAALLHRGSVALSALYCGERAALAGMGGEALLTPHCASYVSIRLLALPAVVLAAVAQAVCIGERDTRTPMIAVALASGLNLVGDFVLVSGLGLGIAGAAWATSASQICAAGLLLRVLAKRGLLGRRRIDDGNLVANGDGAPTQSSSASAQTTKETILSILSFIPFLFVMAIKIGMHNSCAATAASLGGAPAAAHTALFAVGMLCFTFGDVGSSLSQAFLPAFASTGDNDSEGDGSAPSFDVDAARPTIARLLTCTLAISATVVAMSTSLITVFAGQITRDAAVLRQMRSALPLMIATLSLHGTAVTLEGLLLARRNFRALTVTYSGVALTVAAILAAVKMSGAGLLGVWGAYVWFQVSRVAAFSGFGGLWPSSGWVRKVMPWSRRKEREAAALSS